MYTETLDRLLALKPGCSLIYFSLNRATKFQPLFEASWRDRELRQLLKVINHLRKRGMVELIQKKHGHLPEGFNSFEYIVVAKSNFRITQGELQCLLDAPR